MRPWEHPAPAMLYKYFSPQRLHVLTDCRVRFGQRAVFQEEDDHELRPEYSSFGPESEIWRHAISTGLNLSYGLPPAILVKLVAEDPQAQRTALEALQRNTRSLDQLGLFCLSEDPDCDQMWSKFADSGKGFVIGFSTAHAGFTLLKGRGRLGKVTYSDEPFGSALSGILEHKIVDAMFRKRLKFAYEKEWRVIRMLHRLESCADGVFVSAFDPASVREVIIRPECAVEDELQRLVATDARYSHGSMIRQKPSALSPRKILKRT